MSCRTGGSSAKDLAFVAASRHRRKVLETLLAGAMRPSELSTVTSLKLPHVSRALRELLARHLILRVDSGLPKVSPYALTEDGKVLVNELAKTRGTAAVVPLARGTHIHNYTSYLRRHYGDGTALRVLANAGIREPVDPGRWYPLQSAVDLLEAMEQELGDGTYEFIRRVASEIVMEYSSVRNLLLRALPVEIIAELAPAAYCREFNHGRLEVEVKSDSVYFNVYEWISSASRCAAMLGTLQGSLKFLGKEGTVTKVLCVRSGDPCCSYLVEWSRPIPSQGP